MPNELLLLLERMNVLEYEHEVGMTNESLCVAIPIQVPQTTKPREETTRGVWETLTCSDSQTSTSLM
jgi:hypothetical protein